MKGIATAALLALIAGCASSPEADPRYRPAENVLEIVAVLRRHIADDTYRFAPARDFTGRNVYRATLLRLENLEAAHGDALQAGHFADVIAFSKARALERLRAFDLAAEQYRLAARYEGPLQQEARRNAALCDAFAEAATLEPGSGEVDGGDAPLEAFADRRALLEVLSDDVSGSHYETILREELEYADMARARYLLDTRRLVPDGDVRALSAHQHLVMEHRGSKNRNRHMLSLADFYADLAEEYIAKHPPESLRFDPPAFEELVSSAARLYESVANQDGAIERLEAAQRLEGFLAFTLRVDRDRFSR
ncbi:MAG: hypothetical protein HKP27_16550 [Myxococcales bacterium]|nr:hypothetical protein [Myxococcales bacterium]